MSTIKSLVIVVLSFVFVAFDASAMNKCVVDGAVSYQQGPCPSGLLRKQPTLEELNAAEKKRRAAAAMSRPAASAVAAKVQGSTPAAASSTFRCDGRQHCSQMTSCAEAKLFLANCPGVKMDGDNDGIPCESQWCTP